jgi:tRNA(fMet)-specific endonuclease VapC
VTGSYLLDTNIVIAFFSGEAAVVERFEQAAEVLLSSIVVGELDFGARKSSRTQQNLERIATLVQQVTVLDCDEDTAHHYGAIKQALLNKGRPIPENDIWIAASALQNDLTLITRDGHFAEIDGLKIEAW